jgi:4-amino-4-deoxy-L-arabinose transferase-like glycosyltransferase
LASDSGLPELPPRPTTPLINRSAERLDRPLHTLTAEQGGWLLVIAYALVSRLGLLTLRPLDAAEAARSFALAGNQDLTGLPPLPGWISILTRGLFLLAGTSDWCVRIVPALCGLLLIIVACAMRRYIGRAGALALAILLTLSPGFTYYSRTYALPMPAALIALATLYLFCALAERPSPARAGWLGASIGLMMATPPDGRLTAIAFALTLLLLGLYRLFARRHPVLSIRVWFNRHAAHLLAAVLTTIIVWIIAQLLVPDSSNSAGTSSPGSQAVPAMASITHFYLRPLILDEFLIVIAAAIGGIAVITARLATEFAASILLWTAISVGLAIITLPLDVAYLPVVLLPMALLGGLGIEWLHHTRIWTPARFVWGALAVLTLYLQVLSTFVYYAPDASEPSWNRHASLYWAPLTTTLQTRVYCLGATRGLAPADATVYFRTEAAAPRWYLRSLRIVTDPAIASVVVASSANGQGTDSHAKPGDALRQFDFAYAMTWPFDWNDLTFGAALRYIFLEQAWTPPVPAGITITARSSAPPDLSPYDTGG